MEGSVAFSGTLIGGITGGGEGTNDYNQLINKPSINGIPLSGNKTSSDLHLFTGDYSDLNNKPTINGVTVEGSLTSADLNMFDGDYDHLTNKPTLFSGDYDDLTDKPTINGNTLVGNKTTSDLGLFSGNYNDLTNKPTLFSGDYDDLTDKPRINNHTLSGDMSSADLDIFSGDYNDLTNKPTLFSGDYNDLTNKPTIPVIEFNPVAAAVDEVDKASLNGVIYDIKDSAARSDVALAIDNAAAVYDPEGEYLVGDYCTHDGIMYQCNTDIVSPGEDWDPTHWDVTDCGIEFTEIKQSLSDLQNITVGTPRKVGKWGNYDRYELWLEGTTPTMTANTWTQIKSYTFNTASIIEKIFTISDSGGLIFNDYNTSSTSYVTSYIKNDGIYLRVGNGAAFSEQKFYCKVTYVS